mmetsp:Transcript_12140/g.30903  ORF Transcript_12140/g.30903 Transcript_12140/m.30903 type:complete len:88 (+) Transcript_12140:197-460(+)
MRHRRSDDRSRPRGNASTSTAGRKGYGQRAQRGGRSGPRAGGNRVAKDSGPPVDHEKTCPLLLRIFTKLDAHHDVAEYSNDAQTLQK